MWLECNDALAVTVHAQHEARPEAGFKLKSSIFHRLEMAGAVGLEPTTTGFGDRYSTN